MPSVDDKTEANDWIQREACLRMAAAIERRLLPVRAPGIEGVDIAGWCMYSGMLGGDFFDYHDFSGVCCPSRTRLGLVVGDASGHGLGSALLMTSARAYLRARAMQPGDLGQVVADVNRLMCMDVKSDGHFVTLFYAAVFGAPRAIEWVRAGHEAAMLYDPSTGRFDSLMGSGMALGVDAQADYPISRREGLGEGTIVLLGSDGLWEDKGRPDRTFNKADIQDLVRHQRHAGAEAIAGAVADAARDFFQGEAPQDDVTLVVVKFT